MNRIEVSIMHETHSNPAGMMMFLARLTQRGHNIKTMSDLEKLYLSSIDKNWEIIKEVTALPHGTIKRFTPITVAIVGASRRFLAQARTHHVGMTFVSASLQYSDYSGKADFVIPYALMKYDIEHGFKAYGPLTRTYLKECEDAMKTYEVIAKATDNDTAGYAAPQGLRNILIITANHEAWMNFIRARACNRNTIETQYVTLKIWEQLLNYTRNGDDMFAFAGPDCIYGICREGKMSCGEPITFKDPSELIFSKFPLLDT